MTDQELANRMIESQKELESFFNGPFIETRTREQQIADLIESQMRCEATYPESERISLEPLPAGAASGTPPALRMGLEDGKMEINGTIRTWKQLDEAIRATGNRMFYVVFYGKGAALKMDTGTVITDKLAVAVAHIRES